MAEKSVSTDSFASAKSQSYKGKKLRIAMIGCGGISEVHLRALQTFRMWTLSPVWTPTPRVWR